MTTQTNQTPAPSNKIRNTRQYVSAVLKSNFGVSQIKKNSAFAIAFEKALTK